MKALEKERDRRYETASAMAADLQHYLNDEPVAACPPSAWYRLRKLARRYRGRLIMASVVAAALLVLAGSIGWVVRDREARQASTAEQVRLALSEAGTLQDQQKWGPALAAVKRAEVLLASGSGDAEQHRRAQELRADLEMAAHLDSIRANKQHGADSSFRSGDSQAANAYAAAFRGHGLDLLADTPESCAARIQASRIREQLLAALDDWILVQPDATVRERLRAVAELADADVWRSRMRRAVVANDRRALEEMAARPEVADFPPTTAHLLGQALANAGAGARAVQVLTAAQLRHPQDFYINYRLGIELLWGTGVKHDPGTAAGYLRAALVARPDYSTVYMYLGIALTGKEHLDEVIALNRKALELDPPYHAARINLGRALVAQGKLDDAIAEYHKGLALEPKEVRLLEGLGRALLRKGKLDEAVTELRKAVAINPQSAEAHTSLGVALDMGGKLDEALAEHRKAVAIDPRAAVSHFALALALTKQGKIDEAIAEYRQVLALNPKDAETHETVGRLLFKQGRLDDGIAEFRRALAIDPRLDAAHLHIAGALVKQGKFDEALAEYKQALALDPKDARAHESIANVLLMQGKREEALAAFDQAIRWTDGPARQRQRLGRAITLAHLKDHARATAEAEALATAADADAALLYNAACVFALSAAVVPADAGQREKYAGRAVELLRQATDRGWSSSDHIRKDADLAILRGREDFRKLLEELQARAKRQP
jgi:tetratricopeptide (TPR) repeat protein